MIIGSILYDKFNFPAGEMHIKLKEDLTGEHPHVVNVLWDFKNNEELVELLLYVNALEEAGHKLGVLTIPYFPFSRQDRVAAPGDTFSLKVVCNLINSLGAEKILVCDPHSDVLTALLKNVQIVSQEYIFSPQIMGLREPVTLISPDGGALKKIYKVAEMSSNVEEVVECSKLRNVKTGEISGVKVNADPGHLDDAVCVIVDDICDGGRTFIEIAKAIRANHSPRKIVLMVTHGLFTKGMGVFSGLIDEIHTRHGVCAAYNPSQANYERRAV